jgi:hypothetical protein
MAAGALAWKPSEMAANGTDRGCVEVDFARLPAAVDSLEGSVLAIKGRGDKAGAEHLVAQYVDDQDEFAQLKATIAQRYLRAPRATFVYSLRF